MDGGWPGSSPAVLIYEPEALASPIIQRSLPVEGITLVFEAIAFTKSPLKRARDHFMFSQLLFT